MLIYYFVAFNTDHSLQKKLCSKNESISSYLTKACVILHSTVADLVVPVPVRSGSVPKIIGRYLKLSTDTYKSNSVSFEPQNCRLIVISVGRQ